MKMPTASEELEELKTIVMTKAKLARRVEALVQTEHLSYVEALIQVCEETGIDPTDIAKLVTGSLKDKVAVEAMDRNIIPKTNTLYGI